MQDFTYLHVEEDILPPWQPYILTTGLEYFHTFITLVLESKASTGYSTMAAVVGRAGIGKSIAIRKYLQDLPQQPHTGLSQCIEIRIKSRSTTLSFAEDLLTRLGERLPRSRASSNKLADYAAHAILAYDIRLIIADEADNLNELGFEFIRYIYAKTGCSFIPVGLPKMLHVMDKHEQFSSRTRPCLHFPSPTEEEVLTIILPQLIFPRWEFDPTSEEDRSLGRNIWRHAHSSFRDLRVILQYASQVATYQQHKRITERTLEATYQFLRAPQSTQYEESPPQETQTDYEQQSYKRQAQKRKKKTGEEKS